MNIKNKIIKWLGGYTQDELIEKKTIEFCRTEKQIFPLAVEFTMVSLENVNGVVKYNLCRQIAEFMFDHNLLSYDISHDYTNDGYIIRAKAYVREP